VEGLWKFEGVGSVGLLLQFIQSNAHSFIKIKMMHQLKLSLMF